MAESSPTPEPAGPPAAARLEHDHGPIHPESVGRPVNLRRWFFGLLLPWLVTLAVIATVGARYRDSSELAYRVWLLASFAFYLSLACTFFPVPTSPVVALAAVPGLGLAPGLVTRTLLIAAVGAAATMMANLNDYHLWTFVLQHRKVAAIRTTRFYRVAVDWFSRSPWWTLVAFTFIPIPVDVVRLLAITFRYPRLRFAAACYVGRFARYGLLAGAVSWADRWAWQLAIAITIMTVAGGLTFGLRRLIRLVRGMAPAPVSRPDRLD